jgi:hypothetical protein
MKVNQWESEHDDTPPGWWEEFDTFLRANRMNFEERDLPIDNK